MKIEIHHQDWQAMSAEQRSKVIGAVVVQALWGIARVVLTIMAIRDIRRRMPEEIRGPKGLWTAGIVAHPAVALAYFLIGRKPNEAEHAG